MQTSMNAAYPRVTHVHCISNSTHIPSNHTSKVQVAVVCQAATASKQQQQRHENHTLALHQAEPVPPPLCASLSAQTYANPALPVSGAALWRPPACQRAGSAAATAATPAMPPIPTCCHAQLFRCCSSSSSVTFVCSVMAPVDT